MRRLNKIILHEAVVLENQEMKMISGGSGVTDCSTTCSNGVVLTITDCNGNCSAIDGVSVTCKGKTQSLTKECVGTSSGASDFYK